MKDVRITLSAETDLLLGHDFYERQQAGIGEYFLDSLFSDIDSLALFGGIHPHYDQRLYRTFSKRFPYAIYYEASDNVVLVVAILDYRQDPGKIAQALQQRAG